MEPRDLPSVAELMATLEPVGWAREITADIARRAIDKARRAVQEGGEADPAAMAREELARIKRTRPV